MDSPTKHRNRSHTITSRTGEHLIQVDPNVTPTHSPTGAISQHEANLCGYDSFLHATICTNTKNGVHLAASPMLITTPNRLIHHHKNKLRPKHEARTHHAHHVAAAQAVVRQQQHQQAVQQIKLSPSLLNQLNPNLSAEQKLTRTINQVEMWLERDQAKMAATTSNELKLTKNKLTVDTTAEKLNNSPSSPNNNPNVNNNTIPNNKTNKVEKVRADKQVFNSPTRLSQQLDNKSTKIDNVLSSESFNEKLRITEDLAESNVTIVSPKKSYNKEALIASATKKVIKTTELRSPTDIKTNNFVVEYASIPVAADASECENLLRASDEEPCPPNNDNNSTNNSAETPSTVHRYVHIHHHYHHFEDASTVEDS